MNEVGFSKENNEFAKVSRVFIKNLEKIHKISRVWSSDISAFLL